MGIDRAISARSSSAAPLSRLRAGRVVSALQDRIVAPRAGGTGPQWFVLFLDSGRARITTEGSEEDMSGPALRWGPLPEDMRIRVAAGSSGFYLFLDEAILDDALGSGPEAADLRAFSARPLSAAFARGDRGVARIETLFEELEAEAARPDFGAEMSVAAHLRLLLVHLWRTLGRSAALPASAARPGGTSRIARFRALVEAHFRARWTAQAYAEEMGISYDRLHDLCLRAVGKPPARLVRERCLHEARVLLQRDTLSTENVAAMLGFSSASQFNHFFKAMAGETPGAYRRRVTRLADAPREATPQFADWP